MSVQYKQDSLDRKLAQLRRYLPTNDYEDILTASQDQFFDGIEREGNVRFINWLTDEFDTLPFKYYWFLKQQLKNDQLKPFIERNIDKINECRELYMKMYVKHHSLNDSDLLESIRQILIDAAHVDRKQLDYIHFKREVAPRLLHLPMLMNWRQMYDFYRRNTTRGVSVPGTAASFIPATSMHPQLPDKYHINLDEQRQLFKTFSPWRSPKKLREYVTKNKISLNDIDKTKLEPDSFNWSYQRSLMRHHVAPPHTFVLDYMHAGRYRYMLAINVNTRKAFFAIPTEITRRGNSWHLKGQKVNDWHPTAESAIENIDDLMMMTTVKGLIMDQESAWTGDKFQVYLQRKGIAYRFIHKNNFDGIIETTKPSRSNHSTTSLIDRLIKTIRSMNYNVGNANEIDPQTMAWLIDEYNNSPHTTLSKILHRTVTPNDVDQDESLERKVVSELSRQNFIQSMRSDSKVSGNVRVMNESNIFDKVKPKLLPGYWTVIKNDDGLVELVQNNKRIKVNRWMVKSDVI